MDISPDKQNIDRVFSNTAYYIDFYQRDYRWTDEPVPRRSTSYGARWTLLDGVARSRRARIAKR